MIILDTNVVSEPLKSGADQAVLKWLDAQAPETLYLTTVSLAELLAGLEVMPAGRRRTALKSALVEQIAMLFEGRILAFDRAAADAFSRVYASAQSAGNPISFADCAIAGMAAANGFSIATRNVRDFKGAGVTIIDPWTAAR